MKKKIVVLYKKSALALAKQHRNKQMLSLATQIPDSFLSGINGPVDKVKQADAQHTESLKTVKAALKKASKFVETKFVYRAKASLFSEADLVITVGGDGTYLWASKFLDNSTHAPLLGINSAPDSSHGHFCSCDADEFESWGLDKLLSSISTPWHENPRLVNQLGRLAFKVNGEYPNLHAQLVLNDVLIAAAHPADVTKLTILLNQPIANASKAHVITPGGARCSGLWVCTQSGSTGAVRSAGGLEMNPRDQAYNLQYLIREPCISYPASKGAYDNIALDRSHGIFSKTPGEKLLVIFGNRKGLLCPDGKTGSIPLNLNDNIEITLSMHPLCALNLRF